MIGRASNVQESTIVKGLVMLPSGQMLRVDQINAIWPEDGIVHVAANCKVMLDEDNMADLVAYLGWEG